MSLSTRKTKNKKIKNAAFVVVSTSIFFDRLYFTESFRYMYSSHDGSLSDYEI